MSLDIKRVEIRTKSVLPALDGAVRVPITVVEGDTMDEVADGVRDEMVLATPPFVVFLRRSLQRNVRHVCSRHRH